VQADTNNRISQGDNSRQIYFICRSAVLKFCRFLLLPQASLAYFELYHN